MKLNDLPVERRAEVAGEILEKYLSGDEIKALAPAYGVNPAKLYSLLLRTREDEWKAAQAAKALERLEAARHDLSKACDPISINKANALLRSYEWELEKVSRAYGKSQQEEPNVIQINIGINRREPVTIDAQEQK